LTSFSVPTTNYCYTSQGEYIFCVNHNKTDMQNVKLLCAIGNCMACQMWQACCRLPTPGKELYL